MLVRIIMAAAVIGAVAGPALAGDRTTVAASKPRSADFSPLSNSAELNMIQLQSLVSQRQVAVGLTTNVLRGTNAAQRTVIGNLR